MLALKAILAHNGDVLKIDHESDFDYALTCAETITGLIVATALVYPDKKLKSVKPKSVRNSGIGITLGPQKTTVRTTTKSVPALNK